MKFLVPTYGTDGDVRPMAALCRSLMDGGHEAVLMADRETLRSVEAIGIPVIPLSGDIKGVADPTAAIAHVVGREHDVSGMANALAGIANASAPAWLREIVAAGKGSDAIVSSGLAAFVGHSAAEHLGIMAIGAGFIPISPTANFPSPFLPHRTVPRWFNQLSHRFVNALIVRAFRKATNAARAEVCGLPPRNEDWSSHPMLYGVSPTLIPPPDDWPETTQVCGQWALPERDWMPPDSLRQFLAAGEAPVYVGFGSMVGFDRPALLEKVVAAVDGRRALFSSGWGGDDGLGLPGNFHVIGDTPHSWLLPQVSLVVHHGGSGTSHSATRAGVPSVVVSFAGDQGFWGERLWRAGVAGPALNGHKFKASQLARSMDYAEREEVRQRAAQLGEGMRAEDGLGFATRAIERIMSSRGC